MKIFKNILTISACILGISLTSCHKNFDPKSYAPPLIINGYTASSQIEKDALVGYYAFNGSLIDSVSGQLGVSTNTTFGIGEVKQGLQGANNGYVTATPNDKIKALQSFTISEWVNTQPPATGIIGIFTLANTTAFWGNIEVFFENGSSNTNGIFKMHIANATSDGFYVVSNLQNLFGHWTNLTYTYSQTDGTCQLYINGSIVNTGTAGITGPLNFQNIGPLVFGCDQFQTTPSETSATSMPGFAAYNLGLTDEVKIYNKVLTATEISSLIALQGRGK
jgi:hypothetical protein